MDNTKSSAFVVQCFYMPTDEVRNKLSVKEKQLIDNIKHTRMDNDLTQEELSVKLNKNANYMGMLESYRRGISFRTLFKIANVLGVKVAQFFKDI